MPKGTQRHRRQGSYAQQHQQVRGEELCSYGLGDTPSSSECGPLLTVAPDLREMIVPRDFTPSPTPSPPNQPRTTVPPTPTDIPSRQSEGSLGQSSKSPRLRSSSGGGPRSTKPLFGPCSGPGATLGRRAWSKCAPAHHPRRAYVWGGIPLNLTTNSTNYKLNQQPTNQLSHHI